MKKRIFWGLIAAGFLAVLQGCSSPGSSSADAKPAAAGGSAATKDIEKYRQMLADGNPADLYEAAGEDIWKTPMGPKKVSLQKCDLGMGPGVVKGAYTQLPKYFKDTNKVQDLESRLVTCMTKMQGYDEKEIIKAGFSKGKRKDIEAVAAYVVAESKDMPINVVAKHPKEKLAYEQGKKSFFYQGGPMDFSCATCHASDGKRIRLQDLPNITAEKGAAAGWGYWPAYRVSSGTFWTMQRRLNDCYRQQRFPEPIYTSDDTIAVSMYMAVTAKGGLMHAPGLKR
jgi:L-cysteine S-thiosulfotransferase